MTVTVERSAEGTEAIRQSTIETRQAHLDDLPARISATRWPEKAVDADSQGVQLVTMRALAHYWETDCDWHTPTPCTSTRSTAVGTSQPGSSPSRTPLSCERASARLVR